MNTYPHEIKVSDTEALDKIIDAIVSCGDSHRLVGSAEITKKTSLPFDQVDKLVQWWYNE